MAVVPSPHVVARLAALDRPARPGLRWTGPDQWHVTLRFFASVDPSRLEAALDLPALALVAGEPVVARCGPAPGALSRYVWALPVSGLDGLAASVIAATASLGPTETRPFRGHLTLARAKRAGVLGGLRPLPFSCEWAVEEIVAVKSELRRSGARHAVISRRAL